MIDKFSFQIFNVFKPSKIITLTTCKVTKRREKKKTETIKTCNIPLQIPNYQEKKETHSLMSLDMLIIGQQLKLRLSWSFYLKLWQTKKMQDKTNVISIIIMLQTLLIMHLRKFHTGSRNFVLYSLQFLKHLGQLTLWARKRPSYTHFSCK